MKVIIFGATGMVGKGVLLKQHARNRRQWLPGGASGIDESPSIKVIALLHAMTPSSMLHRVICPAVVNALFRLTGKRYRTLPLVTL